MRRYICHLSHAQTFFILKEGVIAPPLSIYYMSILSIVCLYNQVYLPFIVKKVHSSHSTTEKVLFKRRNQLEKLEAARSASHSLT